MERWRDRLLTGKPEQQQAFMEAYPDADRQTIRQLVRQATKEAAEGKPPAASRKLFKLIREVVENADKTAGGVIAMSGACAMYRRPLCDPNTGTCREHRHASSPPGESTATGLWH